MVWPQVSNQQALAQKPLLDKILQLEKQVNENSSRGPKDSDGKERELTQALARVKELETQLKSQGGRTNKETPKDDAENEEDDEEEGSGEGLDEPDSENTITTPDGKVVTKLECIAEAVLWYLESMSVIVCNNVNVLCTISFLIGCVSLKYTLAFLLHGFHHYIIATKMTLPMIVSKVNISPDALRMRARRLCEKKISGRCNVSPEIRQDYLNGGESREIIELALLEALAKYGVQRNAYKKVKDMVVWESTWL